MWTWPVVMSVSTATRLRGSWASIASRIESLIWSAILSGWPSVTDSDVKRRRGTRYSLGRAAGASGTRAGATLTGGRVGPGRGGTRPGRLPEPRRSAVGRTGQPGHHRGPDGRGGVVLAAVR